MLRRTLNLAATIPAVVWVLASPALAQERGADGAPSDAGSEANPIGDIIVTAQRRSESLQRTPVAVSALSGEALQQRAIVSEADLQSAVPGLTIKAGQTSNQLNYSLRGQTVDTFSSSRPSVLPYVNEIQVGSSGASAFYDLESVQVLKGPQGTLFGRNSTGGAVVFTTVKPKNEFGGYVTLRAGNYDNYQAEGAVNVPLVDDKVLLRVAGFFQRRDGFQYNIFDGRRFGKIKRENIRGSLTLMPSDTFTNELVVDYGHTGGNSTMSVGYNARPDSAGPAFVPANQFYDPGVDAILGPGAWDAFLAAHPKVNPAGLNAEVAAQRERGPFRINVDGLNFYRSKNLLVSNISTWALSDNLDVKNIIGYVWQKSQRTGEYDGTVFPIDDTGDFGVLQKLHQFSEEIQLQGKGFDQNLQYVVGFYYSKERDNTRSTTHIFEYEPFIPETLQINHGITRNETVAGYAQGTLSLEDMTGVRGLGVTAGMRYSSERIEFSREADDYFITNPNPNFITPQRDTFKKISWQIGLQEQVDSNLLLYIVTRRSNRSGGFNFFAPPVPGYGNEGGGEYRPEIATDVELGVKYRGNIGVPLRFNLAGYQMWIDDIQRSNYVSIFGSLAGITVNVPKAKVTGFELDGSIQPASWLSVGGSVNYTVARFTDNLVSVLGNPAVAFSTYPDTPKWSGLIYADISADIRPGLKISLHGDVYGQTSTYFASTAATLNPGAQLPKYAIANFRVGLDQEDQGWSLAVNLKNAFDKTYYVGGVGFSSLLGVNTALPGDPRTVLVEARYKF